MLGHLRDIWLLKRQNRSYDFFCGKADADGKPRRRPSDKTDGPFTLRKVHDCFLNRVAEFGLVGSLYRTRSVLESAGTLIGRTVRERPSPGQKRKNPPYVLHCEHAIPIRELGLLVHHDWIDCHTEEGLLLALLDTMAITAMLRREVGEAGRIQKGCAHTHPCLRGMGPNDRLKPDRVLLFARYEPGTEIRCMPTGEWIDIGRYTLGDHIRMLKGDPAQKEIRERCLDALRKS